jgi:hypothetical protein
MAHSDVFTLGLGLTPPWRVVDQRLETGTQPNELHLAVAAEPGPLPLSNLWPPMQTTRLEGDVLAPPQLRPARLLYQPP